MPMLSGVDRQSRSPARRACQIFAREGPAVARPPGGATTRAHASLLRSGHLAWRRNGLRQGKLQHFCTKLGRMRH